MSSTKSDNIDDEPDSCPNLTAENPPAPKGNVEPNIENEAAKTDCTFSRKADFENNSDENKLLGDGGNDMPSNIDNKEANSNKLVEEHNNAALDSVKMSKDPEANHAIQQDEVESNSPDISENNQDLDKYEDMGDDDDDMKLRWDDDDEGDLIFDDLDRKKENLGPTDDLVGDKKLTDAPTSEGKHIMTTDDQDTSEGKENIKDIAQESTDISANNDIRMETEEKFIEDKSDEFDNVQPTENFTDEIQTRNPDDYEPINNQMHQETSSSNVIETIATKLVKDSKQEELTLTGNKDVADIPLDNIKEDIEMDISMDMEEALLKDGQIDDIIQKLDSETKISVDTSDASVEKITTDIENTIQALGETDRKGTRLDHENEQKCLEADIKVQHIDLVNTDPKTSIIIEEKTESSNTDNTNTEKDLPVANAKQEMAEISSLESSYDISMKISSQYINTDHALTKPDVMLEIPTQELIDIDDTDISINLDGSGDGENDIKLTSSTMTEEKGLEDEKTETKKDLKQLVPEIETDVVETVNKIDEMVEKLDGRVKVGCEMPENVIEDTAIDITEKEISSVAIATEDCPIATTSNQDQDIQPSTSSAQISSKMTPDTSDELPEIADSLGLLAESSGRVMEDDEEPDDDDDGDDDDEFDPEDESSNPMTTAEHSEDSNTPNSETEAPKGQESGEIQSPVDETGEFQFRISNIESDIQAEIEKKDLEEDSTLVECTEDNSELPVVEDTELLDVDHQVSDQTLEETLVKVADAVIKGDKNDQATEMDVETVKLSDTSDNEVDVESGIEPDDQIVMSVPTTPNKVAKEITAPEETKKTPKKLLQVSQGSVQPVFNIVDLEDSDEEIKEDEKKPDEQPDQTEEISTSHASDVTSVNIPKGIDVMSTSCGIPSDIIRKEGEIVISGVPKPTTNKHTSYRLNTSELSIKTVTSTPESTLVIPETKIAEEPKTASKPKLGLEIFSLDSDEEEIAASAVTLPADKPPSPEPSVEPERPTFKCINSSCTSGPEVPHTIADTATATYYGATKKRKLNVCQICAEVVARNTQNLINGIKEFSPLLGLCTNQTAHDLVEISDSDDDDSSDTAEASTDEPIGSKAAQLLEENLASLLNEAWRKYKLDDRLKDTEIELDAELAQLEKESKEVHQMLDECQVATDKLRKELYATFEHERKETDSFVIFDTPLNNFMGPEQCLITPIEITTRQSKRRLSSANEIPAKKAAIPLGYTPLDHTTAQASQKAETGGSKLAGYDDKDVSVVKLSAEAAPASLPPVGEVTRPPLKVGLTVYAMRNAFGPWLKGKLLECQPRINTSFSVCRVKFDHKIKNPCKVLPARCLAYCEPADVRMTIGTRVIALFKDENADKRESFYSGVVAEIPNPVNNYRYLVFFDDGYAQYVQHSDTRLVCESSNLVWEEVHPFSREFVREYLLAYPERPMVRLHEGQSLKTEWNGRWLASKVLRVDASLAQVMFTDDGRREWIYRGSTRLAPLYLELRAAERHRQRPMPRSKAQTRGNVPYVEYTRSEDQANKQQQEADVQQIQNEEIHRQRAVAKKSTSIPTPAPQQTQHSLDTVTSRVVYYTPKNAVKPSKMAPHTCGPKCKRTDVLSLKDLRTYNPLAKPLLSGWERQIVRFKGHKEVMYRAPCGRRLRDMRELHGYLRRARSDLPVDLFDFHPATHCLAEFVLNKCLVGKKDLSHGKENVPVPCVNYYDSSLPEFCSYNTERTPTAGVPLNLDPEFLCGCDCTDDCQDKTKCACWKMTLEGARTIGFEGDDIGYEYKRLPEPLPSGIYECNSRCKCKDTCLNRVAQHPLQLKLQVFKTLNRGWGIRALNDVPKGSFLCVYAGNLLTDATANLDGLNEGDEYLAELDYIEVVEQMKEGYEEDIPAADKRLDKKELAKQKKQENDDDDEEEELPSSEEEGEPSKNEKEDGDFQPGFIGMGVMEFSKRLRKRDREKKEDEDKQKEKGSKDDDCITISDDEEVREPSRFMAQAGMGGNEFVSKYKSVRALFGEDEACYIMDAKVQGNIGRYLNHSCTPNVFVQNVFVDTHDPRFPWVAFFALSHIKAGTELTWNYNYDVGSVPGKILYCYCGAVNCRGRLL